jgi:hypothetical protein
MMAWRRCGRAAVALAALGGAAAAESCTKSRDYILATGDLAHPASAYQNLFKTCLETLNLSNVKDAFILTDGAVAAIPRNDTIAATAGTLSEFCTRFPRSTLRFVPRTDVRQTADIARAVKLSSSGATSCSKMTGAGGP